MNRSSLRIVAIVLAIILLLVAAIGGFIWIKFAGLKTELAQNLGKALGAKVDVNSLDLSIWKQEIRAAGISLENERIGAPWEKGEIAQAVVHFHFSDLFASTMPLSVEVSSWSVSLRPVPAGITDDSSSTPDTTASSGTSSHSAVKVTSLTATDGEVTYQLALDRKIELHGVSFESSDNGAGLWTTDLRATTLVAGSLQTGPNEVHIEGDKDKITFSKLQMQCGQGMIAGDGDIALADKHAIHLVLKSTNVPVQMLVGVKWQMQLSGFANGDLTYSGDDQGSSAKGQLSLAHGKFNVLPWLGKVTALVGLPDITNVEVDKATTDIDWKNQILTLSNVDVRKTDVVRLAGTVTINSDSQVDGKLKLGLPSTITAKWPALQDKVFTDASEDYNWTDVHLTGPPDHLQEDLTSRVLAIGIDQGSGLINDTTQKAMDLFKSFMK
jgi:hypothetical protein